MVPPSAFLELRSRNSRAKALPRPAPRRPTCSGAPPRAPVIAQLRSLDNSEMKNSSSHCRLLCRHGRAMAMNGWAYPPHPPPAAGAAIVQKQVLAPAARVAQLPWLEPITLKATFGDSVRGEPAKKSDVPPEFCLFRSDLVLSGRITTLNRSVRYVLGSVSRWSGWFRAGAGRRAWNSDQDGKGRTQSTWNH